MTGKSRLLWKQTYTVRNENCSEGLSKLSEKVSRGEVYFFAQLFSLNIIKGGFAGRMEDSQFSGRVHNNNS